MSVDNRTEPQNGSPPTTVASPPGYEVLRELGRGGMGVVYLARQLKANRLVALKMILGGPHADPGELARFRAEAEAIARLQHPNIVQIFEVGEHQGLPFFSLEYCAGGNLATQLDGTPQEAHEAARLIEVLARAMQAAHEQHVIHRDLKPANVLLAAGGTMAAAKITDFGLAKRLDDVGQTHPGAILGTASYMAPEQADERGRQLGPTADVYALGAILYECLTGRPPFKAATMMDTLVQVLHAEPVPPSRLAVKVPRDLETICLKCLHKEPSRRYVSAQEFGDDLARFLRGEPVQARPVGRLERGWRWARRNPALAAVTGLAAVALLLAVGLGVVYQESLAAGRLREEQAQTRTAYEQAETFRRRAQEGAARLALERGQTLCEQNEMARGLLWLAHSLQLTPPEAVALQEDVRASLARWYSMLHPLEAVHQVKVNDRILALSADGTRYLSGRDGVYQVRDLTDGAALGEPLHHGCTLAEFAPVGTLLATAGIDLKVRLWDGATGKEVAVLPHQSRVAALAFTHDGRILATRCGDALTRYWDAQSGKLLTQHAFDAGAITALTFSPDDRTLLSGSTDYTARLWNAATGRQLLPAPLKHQGWVRAVAFHPQDKRVVTGSEVNELQQWDVTSGKSIGPAMRHQDDVSHVTCSPDGALILSGSLDATARLWDAATGNPLGHPLLQRGAVAALAFTRSGETVHSAGADGSVRRWRVNRTQPFGLPLRHDGLVMAVAIDRAGKRAATGSLDGTARLWDLTTGKPLGEPWRHGYGVWCLAFSPDSKTLVTGSGDGTLTFWECDTGKVRHQVKEHRSTIWVVSYDREGKRVVSAGFDHLAHLWDAQTGERIGRTMEHGDRVLVATFSPDGRWVLTASHDKTAKLWRADSAQEQAQMAHPGSVYSVRFHPDGQRFVTACKDGLVRWWDLADTRAPLDSHRVAAEAEGVFFNRDGTLLAAISDSAVHLWNTRSRTPHGKPLRHQSGRLWEIMFSPDNRLVLTVGVDATARLWHAADGTPYGPPLKHRGRVKRAAFAPDGQTILTTDGDHTARLWRLPEPVRGEPERIRLWVEVVTGLELDADEGTVKVLDADTWRQRRERLALVGGPPIP